MKITQQDLTDFVGETNFHKAGLHAIKRATGIVGKHYCTKMTMATMCPLKCGECKKTLVDMVAAINPETTRNAYALLTWLAKTAAAKKAEKKSVARPTGPAKNAFGEAEERDPFADLEVSFGR